MGEINEGGCSTANRSVFQSSDRTAGSGQTVFWKCTRYFCWTLVYPTLFLVLIWAGYILLWGNFHQVDKNFYRSAQLFPFNMPYHLEKCGIKSIINLRGPSRDAWYRQETRWAKAHHVAHVDFGFGDREMLSVRTMQKLIDIIRNAPKPVLVHCKAGADRTSLATALYLYAIKHDEAAADKAFSIVDGHFPWLGSRTVAMDRSFDAYKISTQHTASAVARPIL